MSREILTLQFGNYANYVGTHWWNIQESSFKYDTTASSSEEVQDIDHDVLFREGKTTTNQVTFTPRVIIVDLKGCMGYMPEEGELYNEPNSENAFSLVKQNIAWDTDRIEVVNQKDPIKKPEFQKDLAESMDTEEKDYNFAESVESWIDFSYSRYHPRSISLVNQYQHSNEDNAFDTFTNGIEIWKDYDLQDDICDRIRKYIEECDGCQGFQTIFNCYDGFSGFSVKCLEHLEDEYSKTIFSVPVIPPNVLKFTNADDQMTKSIRVINTALTYSHLSEFGSLFVPLSTMERCWRDLDKPRQFPSINYYETNLYHTSALLASFLDTVSLRYRLKNPSHSNYLSGFCTDMNGYGRKMAAAALSFPFPMNTNEDLIDFLDHHNQKLFVQLTPNANIGTDRIIQSVCCRGIPTNRLKRPANAKSAQRQMNMAAYRCNSVSEMFQLYFQCNLYASMSHVTASETPLTIKNPYPGEIFGAKVNFDGFTMEFENPSYEPKITSVPSLAAVQSSGDLSDTLESLHREVSRIKIAKISRFADTGFEIEEYKESIEKLLDFKEKYDDSFEL